MSGRARRGLALLALLAAGIWPYAYVLGLHPVSRDAVLWITRGAVGSGGWPGWVFGSSHFVGWRPLTALSFTASSVFGTSPLPYRATDLALHLGCAVALVAVHRRLVPSLPAWSGLVAAAMLLVHPVAGLVVPHLARRAYALSTLLALLAVLAWLRARGRAGIAGATALVGAAALAHEAGFVAALALAVLAALQTPGAWRARVLAAWPPVGMAAVLAGLRAAVLRGTGGYAVDAGERWLAILGATATGILGLAPMRTGAPEVPGAVAVALGAVAAGGLAAPLLRPPDPRDEVRTAAAFAWTWLLGLVAVYAVQGVFFPRQVYVPVAPWALLVGIGAGAAAAASGVRRAVPGAAVGVAMAAAAWQSPVLRGPDPVQAACWRAHDRLVRDLRADLADLPPRAVVDAVLPHHRRPSLDALRARDDDGGRRFSGRQAAAWVGAIDGIRFGDVVLYAVDAPVEAPVARVDGDGARLPPDAELTQPGHAELRRGPDGVVVVPRRTARGDRPAFLYVHDGVRGHLVAR